MFSMACTHFCLFFVVVVDLQTCQFLRTTQATLSCLQTQISCSSPRTMMTLVISTTSSMFQFSNLVTMVLLYCVLLCFQLSISLMPSTGHLNQTRRDRDTQIVTRTRPPLAHSFLASCSSVSHGIVCLP